MDEEKALTEHLGDLRKVIIYSCIFFIICFAIFIIFIQQMIPLVTKSQKLTMLGPLDVIRFYTGIAGSLSIGVSAPFIGYLIWRFIQPALTVKESKNAIKYIPAMLFSFISGISFGYFVVFPFAYQFLMRLGTANFEMMITTQSYFSFLLMTTIPMGFLFEVPFVLMFLTAIELVTPSHLSGFRKYAYVVMAIVSAIITPPDFVSQLIVLFPLFILYEIGIALSKFVFQNKERKEIHEERIPQV
ncbi:twin-arginine translocase subunit TatC [Lederbergia wuyishanensis]|uniref:Sec-independent protein translocase protein TatC n=1 Tax=Lederbergia wuyishanensis TaxID=1347903 RepID=A0ABU0D8D5_9BACI|nr:twin-arginine translocase subunit TatC [Lederbergia wuyishanensis]MCJ8009210.1 twin-arginine translocase subunit TatC [Lederbergia wuyishanensis]MDQ0344660.1 sec-independent protein translocase protein TatC [Lederbergia wuyishanensis]